MGPLWWGAPPGRGEGTSPLAPHVGGTGPSLCSFSVAPGCVVHVVFPFLRNRFDYFTPPLLATASRFLHWWLPLPPPAVIEYSLAFRSLAGVRVWRRNQCSQFVVMRYEREEGFEACAQLRVSLSALPFIAAIAFASLEFVRSFPPPTCVLGVYIYLLLLSLSAPFPRLLAY